LSRDQSAKLRTCSLMLPHSSFCDETAPRDTLVVLLHGTFGSRLDMLPLAAALASDHDTVAFDIPGHGDAAAMAAGTTVLGALIAELEGWSHPGRQVCIVGYSLGARLALLAARQRPDLVSAVVAISGNPGLEDAAEAGARAAQDRATADLLRSFGRQAGGAGRFGSWLRDTWYAAPLWGVAHPLRADPGFETLLQRRVHGARLAALAEVLEDTSVASQAHLWRWLGDAPMRVLYLAGDDDAKYTAIAQRLSALPAARGEGEPMLSVVVLPGSSHNVVAQAPGATAAVVARFLAGLPPSTVQPERQLQGTGSVMLASHAMRRYSLPLRSPLPTSKLCGITERDGALLLLSGTTTTEGGTGERLLVGVGDLCPLPNRHTESLPDALGQLEAAAARLSGRRLPLGLARLDGGLSAWLAMPELHTSTRCALEMALLHILARAQNVGVGPMLARASAGARVGEHSHLRINGLASLAGAAADAAGGGATSAAAAPHRVLKLKVGSPGASVSDAAAEGEAAGRLLARLASCGLRLRLDANRSWGWDAALAFGRAFCSGARDEEGGAPLGGGEQAAGAAAPCLRWLEYVEEPLRAELAWRLPEWSAATGLPFALDETAEEAAESAIEALLRSDGCAALVLKPTLVGGVEATARLARLAARLGKAATLTAAFESGVAHAHLAHYCHVMGCTGGGGSGEAGAVADGGAAVGGAAHGLATYERLAADVLAPPFCSLVAGDLVDLKGATRALDQTADQEWADALARRAVVVG